MSAVIPFPRIKNRAFVFRHARRAAQMKRFDSSMAYLDGQVDAWAGRLERIGVSPEVIERETRDLSDALRSTMYAIEMADTAQ